jgi:DUF4097 and DUF4098 domain-containing protein YvlB
VDTNRVRHITITVRSHAVTVVASPGGPFEAAGGRVQFEADGHVRVGDARSAVEVRCDEGTAISIATTSGRIECRGRLGELTITTSSGAVTIDAATSIDVRTKSGKVTVGTVDGLCRARTKSSRVDVERAGQLDVATTSGSVRTEDTATGSVQTVSGSVDLSASSEPDIVVRTQSASVEVALPSDIAPALHLRSRSGNVKSRCAEGASGRVEVETFSGSISVSCP